MWYHRISFQLPGSHPITITPSCCPSTNTYPTPPACLPARRSWRPRGAAQVRAGGGTSPLSGAPPSPRDPSWTAWCCPSRGHCLTAGSAPGSGCHGRRHAYGLRRRQRRRSQGNPQLRPLPAGQLTQQLARHCLWLAVHNFVNSGRLEGTLWGY